MDLTQTYSIKLTKQENIDLLALMIISEDLNFFYRGEQATFYIFLESGNMSWLTQGIRELNLTEEVYLTYKGKKFDEWGEEVVV